MGLMSSRIFRQQLLPPLGKTVSHVGDRFRINPVFGECGIGDLGQRAERVSEQQWREAKVGVRSELKQALSGVATTGDRCVNIQEVTRERPAEERADLIRHGVVGMQDRANVELDRVVGAPVGG